MAMTNINFKQSVLASRVLGAMNCLPLDQFGIIRTDYTLLDLLTQTYNGEFNRFNRFIGCVNDISDTSEN